MKEWLYDTIIAVIVAIAVYYSLSYLLSSPMPIVTVVSDSMLPIIHRGDILVTHTPQQFKVGDIIVYRVPTFGYPIVHRIVDIEKRNGETIYFMKGDNNPVEDPWSITRSNIIGKVVFDLPLIGFPRLYVFKLIGI